MPGIEPKDIDISISGDNLTIKGEKMPRKKRKGRITTLLREVTEAFQGQLYYPHR